jgi:hypothetical protein
MRTPLVIALSLLLIASGALAQGHGGHGKNHGQGHGKQGHGQAMRHANPMPNLMKIVKKHGDELGLSDAQKAEMQRWHQANADNMHASFAKVGELEGQLNAAALAGRPKAELMVMASRIMQLRTGIVSTKIDCRDNMRRVLSAEQYAKLLALYEARQTGR